MYLPDFLCRRPTYTSVAATLALFFAMGGTAFAVATVAGPNSVNTAAIQNKAVTTPKLADEAVTNRRIAPGAITSDKLGDGAVTNGKLGDGAVTNDNLGDGAVTSSKLGAGAVTNGRLGDGAVTSGKLANGAVTHAKLAANSVTGGDIENDTLHVADFVGFDGSGTINFIVHPHSCGTIHFGVHGAHVGQVAILTWESAYPLSISFGPLHVANSTLITGSACNLTGHDITGHNIKVRVITLS